MEEMASSTTIFSITKSTNMVLVEFLIPLLLPLMQQMGKLVQEVGGQAPTDLKQGLHLKGVMSSVALTLLSSPIASFTTS